MNNKPLLLIAITRFLNSIITFVLVALVNSSMKSSGLSLQNSAINAAFFLGIYYLLPLLTPYYTKLIPDISWLYKVLNQLRAVIFICIFLFHLDLNFWILALICTPLRVNGTALTLMVNRICYQNNLLRRKTMLWYYMATNGSALLSFLTVFILLKSGYTNYLFIIMAAAALLSNYSFSIAENQNNLQQISLKKANKFLCLAPIVLLNFLFFLVLFKYITTSRGFLLILFALLILVL